MIRWATPGKSMYLSLSLEVGLLIGLTLSIGSLGWIDRVVTMAVGSLPRNLDPVMTAISYMGSVNILVSFAVLWALFEVVWQRKNRAVLILATLSSLPLFYVIKESVRRARPATEFIHRTGLHDYSYPAGHVVGSSAVYGMLAYLLYSRLPQPWNLLAALALVFMIILIGLARVYLGAHFPTDVLGGWLVGLMVVNVLVILDRVIQNRR